MLATRMTHLFIEVVSAHCYGIQNNSLLLIKLVSSFSDVIFSAIGSLVWIVAIITWVITFQLNRADWGEFADSISFIIPLGRA